MHRQNLQRQRQRQTDRQRQRQRQVKTEAEAEAEAERDRDRDRDRGGAPLQPRGPSSNASSALTLFILVSSYGYCTVIWWIFPLLFLCTFPIYSM